VLKEEPEGVGVKDTGISQTTKMFQDHLGSGEVHSKNRRKTDDQDRKITLLDLDDQENIKRVKKRVNLWLRETRVPKKLHNKLERQASEKGLTDNQVDRYIRSTLKKVERRMNRRKSD